MNLKISIFLFFPLVGGLEKTDLDKIIISQNEIANQTEFFVQGKALGPNFFRIIHVFIGPQELKEKFATGFLNFQDGIQGVRARAGEKAIFWVKKNENGNLVTYQDHTLKSVALWLGILEGLEGKGSYKISLDHAKTVEWIYIANEKHRMKRVHDSIQSGDPEKGRTAIGLLWMAKDPKIPDYFYGLSQQNSLPIRVQMKIGDYLHQKKKSWAGSKEEFDLFRRWVNGSWERGVKSDISSEYIFANHLWVARVHHYFSFSKNLDLAIQALANPVRSKEFKNHVCRDLDVDSKGRWKEDDKKLAFSHLSRTVQGEDKEELKLAAAKLFSLFWPFDQDQAMALKKLQRTVKDESVTREIGRILEAKTFPGEWKEKKPVPRPSKNPG